jgi:hypothetical protein
MIFQSLREVKKLVEEAKEKTKINGQGEFV